jgi:heme-degrading monooxygenase HmoA
MAETYTSGVWVVKPGQEDDFVRAWEEFVGWASGFPGSGTFRLVRDVDHPNRFLSFAPWESGEAQTAWRQQPDFPERLGQVRAHCDEFHSSTYELVTVLS